MPKKTELIRFGVSMEKELLSEFDSLCAAKGYENRSEAIRDMARNLLIEDKLKEEKSEGVGTLTLIYNHHQRELEEKLTEYQHQHLNEIITSVHIHLTAHLCLEVLLLRGRAKEIKKVADGLIATKGVQHGKLVMTAVSRDAHQHH